LLTVKNVTLHYDSCSDEVIAALMQTFFLSQLSLNATAT